MHRHPSLFGGSKRYLGFFTSNGPVRITLRVIPPIVLEPCIRSFVTLVTSLGFTWITTWRMVRLSVSSEVAASILPLEELAAERAYVRCIATHCQLGSFILASCSTTIYNRAWIFWKSHLRICTVIKITTIRRARIGIRSRGSGGRR